MSLDAAILRKLRELGDAFVPASELGEPKVVAERIAVLEDAGYEIERHPHLGYRLHQAPDRLIADDIISRLPQDKWIREVLVFEKTNSTNDVITQLARQGAPEGVAVFAEEQSAGRGRLGRRWQSDSRLGLWFSVLLRPGIPVVEWPRLTLWIAYAVTQGIERYAARQKADLKIALKWPNDLYVSGRKLAGILVESSPGTNGFATAGIGLNVNQRSFAPPLDATATSLCIETGVFLDRNGLAASILASLGQNYRLITGGYRQVLDWASQTDYLLGRRVSATLGPNLIEGVAQGLDENGALLVATASGEVMHVSSGEVTRFSL